MERLTERKNGTAMIEGCGSNCKYGFGNVGMGGENVVNLDEAIEIVKKGGVADD